MVIHLAQERLELGKQVADSIKHFLKRFNDRLTLDNPRFEERYLKGELHLLCHFKCRSGVEGVEYVALLNRDKGFSSRNDDVGKFWNRFTRPRIASLGRHEPANVFSSRDCADSYQEA